MCPIFIPIFYCSDVPEMQKVADPADISVLFFSAGANFWAILAIFSVYVAHHCNDALGRFSGIFIFL